MDRNLNTVRREAERAMARIAQPKVGIVTSYDPANYAAKVRIQPEDVETGWLPVRSPWSGNGWGMFCPPSPGDEVEIQHQEGGKEAAYIALRAFGDQFRPLPVPSGEFWLVGKGGQFLKITQDSVQFSDGHGASFTMSGDGNASFTANTITSTAENWNHNGIFNATQFYAEGVAAIPDATYCTGLGLTQNGYITTKGGMIVAIQEAM